LRRTLRHIYIQLERLGIYQDSRQNNEFHKWNSENLCRNLKDEEDFDLDQEEELDALRTKLKEALNARGKYAVLFCIIVIYLFDQYTKDWWDR
jgi:uncharacterized membrane protein YcjF (UPF0283 family)